MIKDLLLIMTLAMSSTLSWTQSDQFRIGVIGLTHTHVHWIFNSEKVEDFEIVGIVEPNKELAQRYADQYGFDMGKVYDDLNSFLNQVKPDAVTAFGTIYDHLAIVQNCAPLGIHVMVEKPLAVSLEHAKEMERLAKQHDIRLLTNYETTWYPTNHRAYDLLHNQNSIGDLRKVIIRDGHRGPKKIGVDPEFLEWLTDPKLNGGGAVIDFGCYGANLMTWITQGERPNTVTAITTQQQSENNPLVDDEAIIILEYDTAVAIIQASWNWPIGRKDMEIYGLTGAIYADNRNDLRVRKAIGYDGFDEQKETLPDRLKPYHDPFAYFIGVIQGHIKPKEYDLSSLENNMIVMEILDAAVRSASLNESITLD